MKLSTLIVAVAMIACMAAAATAGVLTSQQWDFSTDATNAAPEVVCNAFGSPVALVAPNYDLGAMWYDTFPPVYGDNTQGWWDIATGSITLTIPNRPNAGSNSYKDITVAVTYWKDISDAPTVEVSPTAQLVSLDTVQVVRGPVGGAWMTDTWSFHLEPNPDSETITIIGDQFMGSQIDKICVMTDCTSVPEPGSLAGMLTALVGMAGFAIRRRRA